MGDVGDGRLELDELGSVIDHASSLDVQPPEDLLEGNDAVTWTERLQSTGVTPWLRRHRAAVAATAAVVLVAGTATTAYVRSRPPAQDTTVSVTLANWVSDGSGTGVTNDGTGLLVSTYRAVPAHSGDTVRILSVVGPGIRASTAHAHSATAAQDGATVADVAAVVGCDQGDATAATPADFRLRIEQTDAYGRTTTGLVDLPLADGGSWVDSIVGPCVQQKLTELVPATATRITGDPAPRVLTVEATVHNGFGHDLMVAPTPGPGTSVHIASNLVLAPDGTDIVVPVRIRVTDCAHPRLDDAYVPDPGGYRTQPQRAGLNLFATVGPADASYGGALLVPFSPAQQATVTHLLAQMCAGIPPATVTMRLAGYSPDAVVRELPPGGDPTMVGLRMQVDVATSAQRVQIADATAPEDIRNGAVPTILTVSSDVRGSHARLAVDWAAACSSVMPPPTVALTLTSGSRSWPVRVSLADQHLLDAYRVACPGLQPGDFSGMGWTTA